MRIFRGGMSLAFFLIVPSIMVVSMVLIHTLAKRMGLTIYYSTLTAVALLSVMVVFAAVILSPVPGKKFLLYLGSMILSTSFLLTLANNFLIKKQRDEERIFTEQVKAAYAEELKKDSAKSVTEELVNPIDKFEWGNEKSAPEENEIEEEPKKTGIVVGTVETVENPNLSETFPLENVFKPLDDVKAEAAAKALQNKDATPFEEPKPEENFPLQGAFKPLETKPEKVEKALQNKDDAPFEEPKPEENFPLQETFKALEKVKPEMLNKIQSEIKSLDTPEEFDRALSEKVSEPAPVVEEKVSEPALVVEEKVSEPAPVVEEKVSEPATVVEEKDSESAPVVEEKISEPAPVIEEKVSESAHVVEEKVSETAPVVEEKISESAPVVEEKVSEPAPVLEEKDSESAFVVEEKVSEPAPVLEEKDSESAPVVEEKDSKPAQIVEEKVSESAHVVEEKDSKPAQIVEEKILEPAPVVEERVYEPAPVLEEKVSESAPVVEEKVSELATVLEEKDSESALVVEEKISESETLDNILDKAYDARAKGHVWQAIEYYRKALERYRTDEYAPFVAIDLGNLYKENALYAKAIKTYEEALTLPAVKRNAVTRKEFLKNLEYLRVVRDILLKHRALSTPFAKIPREILQEIDAEFQTTQFHSVQYK